MTVDAFLPYRAPRAGAPELTDTHVEGKVHDVGPKGMRFTVPDWDGGKHVFGPAPWPMSRVQPASDGDPEHDHAETAPARGARCLVLFIGGGIDRPWVLGWWPA